MRAAKPYDFAAHLTQTDEATTFAKLHGTIGESDLAGEISVDRGKERLTVRAELHGEFVDVADLRSLFGARPVVEKTVPRAAVAGDRDDDAGDAAPEDPKTVPLRHLFSARVFDATKLGKLDAHATLAFKKLKAADFPALQSLRATAELKDGVLSLKPVDVGLAGGHVTGQLTLDGRQRASASHASIELKDVRLEQLLAAFGNGKNARKGAGALQGYLDLKGEGDSIAKLAASASGPVHVEMAGGAISNLLDAEIALNAGKALKVLIKGDRAIGINNATVAFDFDKGIGKSKAIVLDTDQTQTRGTGTIDLREETLDLVLTPHPKKTALLALHSSIRVHGPIRRPKISLAEKTEPGAQDAAGARENDREQPARHSGERANALHDTPVAQPTGRK